jgi:hypothetical protein
MTDGNASPDVSSPEQQPLRFFQRLTSAYFEPAKAFADVNHRPSWLVLFIILALLSMASAFIALQRVDRAVLIRKSVESIGIQLSQEQMNQALAIQQSPWAKYQTMVSAPAGIITVYLLIAGVFVVLFMLADAPLNYRKTLAVSFWGIGPPAAVESVLSILILLLKDPDTLDVTGGVLMSNLGALVDGKAHPFMASMAKSLDIFSFWKMALLAIGFAAISDRKLTVKKAGIGVIVLWAVYVFGKSLIFGGLRSIVS